MNAPTRYRPGAIASLALSIAVALAAVAQIAPAASEPAVEGYRMPPKEILDILDAPAPPYARISANQKWLITTERDIDHTMIAELAEPQLMLVGTRFKVYPDSRIENVGITRITLKSIDGKIERTLVPPKDGRIYSTATVRDSSTGGEMAYTVVHSNGTMSLRLYDAASGTDRPVATSGLQGKIAGLNFTRDGRYLAFTATTRTGVVLWIADARSATAKKVEGFTLNHVNGGASWTRGHPPLIVRAIPPGRGEPPVAGEVPIGPIVQESYGRTAQGRTFQNLLKDRHDEALFEYYFTNQIFSVDEQGRGTKLGAPGIHYANVSPNGEYLLVTTIHRPYSYQVPLGLFPMTTAVWSRTGSLVKVVNEQPLRDNLPSARDSVLPGIRSVYWRADVPATLMMVEALDGGDPRKEVPKRDRVSLWAAPFTDAPAVFVETELRFSGIFWAFPDLAFLSERSSRTAKTKTWVINPTRMNEPARLLWDRNSEDRYSDPGSQVLTDHPTELRQIPLRSANSIYLQGNGAAKDGAKTVSRPPGSHDAENGANLAIGRAPLRVYRRGHGSGGPADRLQPGIAHAAPEPVFEGARAGSRRATHRSAGARALVCPGERRARPVQAQRRHRAHGHVVSTARLRQSHDGTAAVFPLGVPAGIPDAGWRLPDQRVAVAIQTTRALGPSAPARSRLRRARQSEDADPWPKWQRAER